MTTQEVCDLLGVGPTAIKRWADGGALRCVRTVGGHRRYRRSDVEAFRRAGATGPEGPGTALQGDASSLARELLSADLRRVQATLLVARGQLGAWHKVASTVGEALEVIGDAWERGEVSVMQEHLASDTVARALAQLVALIPVAPGGPRALLVVAPGDDHTLGLSLLEICLAEAGWTCEFAGRATPIEEVARRIDAGAIQMVAASASRRTTDRRALVKWVHAVGKRCRSEGVHLILGGHGAWPDPPPYGALLRRFDQLDAYLAATEVRAREP